MPPKARRAMKQDQWSRATTIYRCGGKKKKKEGENQCKNESPMKLAVNN